LYHGLAPFKQVNKFYEQEFTENSQPETYPLTTTGAGAIFPVLQGLAGNQTALVLQARTGTTTGLQVLDADAAEAFGIPVNENVTYELNVRFRYTPTGVLEEPADPANPEAMVRTKGALYVTLACFDAAYAPLDPVKADRTGQAKWMLAAYKGGRPDVTYTHKGIIYAKNTPAIDAEEAAVGLGQHLVFPPGTRFVVPTVVMDAALGGNNDAATILNVRLVPVPDYSTGFVDTPNLAQFWFDNRNPGLTFLKLKDLLRRYMLPYAATMQVTELAEQPTLARYPKMKVRLALRHPSAWNQHDGTVTATISGGLPPYRAEWDEDPNASDNPSLANLPGGTYRGVLYDSSPEPQKAALLATLIAPARPTAWRGRASTAYCEVAP
jgi:hypothetical protein